MSYALHAVVEAGTGGEYHGEVWDGQTVEERLALCEPQTIRPLLEEYLPRDGRILEAGCGLGRWVIYLRNRGFNVEGVEISDEAVRAIKAYDPDLPVRVGDVLDLLHEDGSFGAYISLGVVEHFKEGPQAALREAHRVLRPGGLAFIAVPYASLTRRLVHRPWATWRDRRRAARLDRPVYRFDEYRYTEAEMRRFLSETGFETIRTAPDDFTGGLNMGLYADWRRLHHPTEPWRLRRAGRILASILNGLSPWLSCSGILCMARACK